MQEAALADKMGHFQHSYAGGGSGRQDGSLPAHLSRAVAAMPLLLQAAAPLLLLASAPAAEVNVQPASTLLQSFWLPDGLCSLYACATSSSMHDSIGQPANPLPRTPVLTWRPKSAVCHVGTVQHAAL